MPLGFRDMMAHEFSAVFTNANEFGTVVSLKRGTHTTTGVSAVVDTSTALVDEGNGTTSTIKSRDYLIRISGYVINGVESAPTAGDLIIDGGKYYQVLPFAGEPQAVDADTLNITYRIHTKQIEAPEDSGDPAYSEAFLRGLLEVDNTDG
jgi:hypothetical protein